MVVALRLDVGIRHQEHRKDDDNDVPSRENQAVAHHALSACYDNIMISDLPECPSRLHPY